MKDQVDPAVKKKRVEIVQALSARQKAEWLQQMIGQTVRVLIEKQEGTTGEGFSENYERVCVRGLTSHQEGSIVPVVLTGADDHRLTGIIKEEI